MYNVYDVCNTDCAKHNYILHSCIYYKEFDNNNNNINGKIILEQ